ncbi:sensor histidine kinase [Chryseobacterium luquanense]|uniref:Histidine kinase n=1 Tax=Chryseobacterium luquanense TaxID=2983766 RepID=A0ABT3Y7N1_9FLAO|nr:histidine kinase [Chryseobacterium luquanense]MCX8534179.1 histidine kinase [Chryseobacterium luquanense]
MVSVISLIPIATFILGEYLHWLYQRFSTNELIDFTPIAAASSAPQILEKYQYYFDAFPGIIIVMGIMIIGYAIQHFLLRIKKERQIQTQQTVAELTLLKSQISPHFLFNVLNSLYSLSLKKSDETPNVILKLSDILRYSLYEAQEKEISISQEIHILNTYIDIERLRLPESASMTFLHDTINESVKIAPMLLLPLIENAFKHGTDSTIGHSYINASLIGNDNRLIFTCENNFKESARKEVGGIGIENIRKRLQLIYPLRHQFKIEKNSELFKISLEIKL